MPSTVFHTRSVTSGKFEAVMTDGGLFLEMWRSPDDCSWVTLGNAVIDENPADGTLWIFEGNLHHPRYSLARLGADEVLDLSRTFGITVNGLPSFTFFGSPAWEGLKEIVASHPRQAAAAAKGSGPEGWLDRAKEENSGGVPNPGRP